jgi:hypothetical protein
MREWRVRMQQKHRVLQEDSSTPLLQRADISRGCDDNDTVLASEADEQHQLE